MGTTRYESVDRRLETTSLNGIQLSISLENKYTTIKYRCSEGTNFWNGYLFKKRRKERNIAFFFEDQKTELNPFI